jgi:Protein of unknown function (DUF1673)
MQFVERFRQYLGWCPNTRTVPRQLQPMEYDTAAGAPVQDDGTPAYTRWLDRYRNRMLLWATFYTIVFIPPAAGFSAIDLTRLTLSLGIIAGLGFFAVLGWRLWHNLETLSNGGKITSGPEGHMILAFVVGSIIMSGVLFILGLLAMVPFSVAMALPAFAMGFALIPWYVLALIIIWERRMGCILMFDNKTRSFIVESGAGYAHH